MALSNDEKQIINETKPVSLDNLSPIVRQILSKDPSYVVRFVASRAENLFSQISKDDLILSINEDENDLPRLPIVSFPSTVNLICLIPRTEYGLEELIFKVFRYWSQHDGVYLLASTNTEKTSLFNSLIDSDLCHIHALGYIQCVTELNLPGVILPEQMINECRNIGQTILIGDIARIDIKHISNDVLVSLSFMTTSHLPINVIETKDDEKFYEKTLEKDQLEVNSLFLLYINTKDTFLKLSTKSYQ
ncbi:unnamed protein product [Rotaria sordida]|uniref:Uncharacterized protein n=1 Tax=Rotaria sordida TaxID=392033 RepID=A0A815UN67_9BILA|nr:unnamed protein product [Rotaria sordida]